MYRIKKIEDYVRSLNLPLGHDFEHAKRVKNVAMIIMAEHDYCEPMLVEASSLMHDIGMHESSMMLSLGLSNDGKREHAALGAEMARNFLSQENLLKKEEIDLVCQAIAFHNKPYQEGLLLLDIIRDADILDLLGVIGISRALTTKANLPLYDPKNVKGETWGFSARDFDRLFLNGAGIGPTIVDQLNFQISCCDNLRSEFARNRAVPLVKTIKEFILNLEKEVI